MMRRIVTAVPVALVAAGVSFALGTAAIAQDNTKAKPAPVLTFWSLPAAGGAITVIQQGVVEPKTIAISPDTIVAGICEDCMLPMKFKASEANKNCAVCGCVVSNAQCIAGKPVKATWQAMFQNLPRGVVLRPVYNTPDSAESGVKSLSVDRHSVLLPVEGLDSQSPDQLAALVKQAGGTKGELVDGGKRLTFAVKDEWTHDRQAKFEKLLAKAGGKVSQPDVEAAK